MFNFGNNRKIDNDEDIFKKHMSDIKQELGNILNVLKIIKNNKKKKKKKKKIKEDIIKLRRKSKRIDSEIKPVAKNILNLINIQDNIKKRLIIQEKKLKMQRN